MPYKQPINISYQCPMKVNITKKITDDINSDIQEKSLLHASALNELYKTLNATFGSKKNFSIRSDDGNVRVFYKDKQIDRNNTKIKKVLAWWKRDNSPWNKALNYLTNEILSLDHTKVSYIRDIEKIFLDWGLINFFIPYWFRYWREDLTIKSWDNESLALDKVHSFLRAIKDIWVNFKLWVMHADNYVLLNGIPKQKSILYEESFTQQTMEIFGETSSVEFFQSSDIFAPEYLESPSDLFSGLYEEYKRSMWYAGQWDLLEACSNMQWKIWALKWNVLLAQSENMLKRIWSKKLYSQMDIKAGALEYTLMRKFEWRYVKNLLPWGNVIKLSLVNPLNDYKLDGLDEDLPSIYLLPPELQAPWMKS